MCVKKIHISMGTNRVALHDDLSCHFSFFHGGKEMLNICCICAEPPLPLLLFFSSSGSNKLLQSSREYIELVK